MAKILVIEDDQSLREALTYNLRQEEFTPLVASDAVSAVELARREKPDLILLDLMLPGGSGFEVCKSIRSFSSAPIIILTARSDDIDRVLGLEIGADDYVTKPFSIRELFARIRANLRRIELDKGTRDDPFLKHGNVHIDVPARQVRVGDAAVTLQPKEFDLLV